MNARVHAPKPCIICGKTMYPEDYASPGAFGRTRACSSSCGGNLQSIGSRGGKWGRLLSHQINGEMNFEEIAAVAGVSRQCIWSIYERALRKLQHNSRVLKMLGEWK